MSPVWKYLDQVRVLKARAGAKSRHSQTGEWRLYFSTSNLDRNVQTLYVLGNTHNTQGPSELLSSGDLHKSVSKLLLDNICKLLHENAEETPCSTCDKLILKLHKHLQNFHGAPQNENTSTSGTNESKRNLRSRKRVKYSEQVQDSIPSRELPKNLQSPCDVFPSASAASTFGSTDISEMNTTNPEIKMEALDLDMDMDYLDYPDLGGSDEEETKIDINYLTGGDVVTTTTVAPENITVIPSSTKKGTKLTKSCPICKRKYLSVQKLNLHLQKSHPGKKSYTCAHTNCGEKFLKEWELKKHEKSHIGKNPFSCDICGKSFLKRVSLRRHKLVHSKPHICEICGKGYPRGAELKKHKLVHSKPMICELCGQGFPKQSVLDLHKRMKHTGEKPFTCSICGKGFAGHAGLHIHQKLTHTNEKPIMCEVCGKSYKTKNSLDSHMIVHTGQKSFVCDLCGKGFFYQVYLREHMSVHTGEWAINCDICSKGFNQKIHFLIHRRTHTGETPFVCQICNKGCTSKRNLQTHMGSHPEATPFVCQTCDERFNSYRNLRIHREIHTKENV